MEESKEGTFGFKAFRKDGTFLKTTQGGLKTSVGEEMALPPGSGRLRLCGHGFHFCPYSPMDCFDYYTMRSVVTRVEVLGKVKGPVYLGNKACTDRLRILSVMEGPWTSESDLSTSVWKRGLLHSPSSTLPAFIRRNKVGVVIEEGFFKNGKLHRPSAEGPAYVRLNKAAVVVVMECYYEEGKEHRPAAEGPAVIHRNNADVVTREVYYKEGKMHRPVTEGPALIQRNDAGVVVKEVYCEDGKEHRPKV